MRHIEWSLNGSPLDAIIRRSTCRCRLVRILDELRLVQPVHLLVEPRPQGGTLLAEQVGVALESVLLVHGVKRIAPGKHLRRFEPRQRRFQPGTDRHPL